MPGVPGWAVLGAGLGQAVKSWQEQQRAQQAQQDQQLRQQMLMMQLKQLTDRQQSAEKLWNVPDISTTVGDPSSQGSGGVGIPISQGSGTAPAAPAGGSSGGAIRNPGDAAIAPFTPFPSQGGSAGKPITWRSDYPGPEAAAATFGPGAPSGRMSAGGALSLENLTQLATQAGFPPDKAPVIAAISMAESKGDPNAYNPEDPAGGSYGVTQINGVHPGAQSARGNPQRAMQLAYNVSKGGQDFSPWSTFTDGTYRSYLPAGGSGQDRTSPAMPAVPGRPAPDRTGWSSPPGDYGSPAANRILGGQAGGAGPQTAQAGGQTMTDAAPSDMPPPSSRGELQRRLDAILPPNVYGGMNIQALKMAIDKTCPGCPAEMKQKYLDSQVARLAPQQKILLDRYKAQQEAVTKEWEEENRRRDAEAADQRGRSRWTDEHKVTRGEALADRDAVGGSLVRGTGGDYNVQGTRARPVTIEGTGQQLTEGGKWGDPVKMEGDDGKPQYVQVNKDTGEVRPVKGLTGDVTKVGSQAAGKPSSPTEVAYWTRVLQGGGALPPGLARTKSGSMLVQELMKNMAASDQSPGDFIAAHSTVKANTTSLTNMTKMSDAAISFEKLAEKNFDVALKLAPDAVPTELGPFFNRWVEQGETALGDPSVPPYVAAMITGANEYAKVMSGSTGTAASTVDARKQAAEMFSPYMSLPQISQVIAVAKADMKNRENTLNEQVGQIKQRLGSTAPNPIAPPATPRATGRESQDAPGAPASGQGDGEVVQNGWRYNAKTHEPIGPAP